MPNVGQYTMMDIQVFLKTFDNEVAAFLLLNAALAPSARRFQGSISIYIYAAHFLLLLGSSIYTSSIAQGGGGSLKIGH